MMMDLYTSLDIYTIKDIPGSGQGAVAARAISRGELILQESPLLTQQYTVAAQNLAAALSRLSRDDQLRFLSLSNAWSIHKGAYNPLVGIWLTNALPCGTPEDPKGDLTQVEGIFPAAARFNGSCQPNVCHWWDDVAQRLLLHAIRDIDAGEELCLGYVDVLVPRADRRAGLEEYYNFLCLCEVCSLRGQALRDSDRRRRHIAQIRTDMVDYLDSAFGLHKVSCCPVEWTIGHMLTHVAQIKLAIKLLQDEGLVEHSGASFYIKGFDFCASACFFRVRNDAQLNPSYVAF